MKQTIAALSIFLVLSGCASKTAVTPAEEPATPDYSRPLPPGASALRLLTNPAEFPDVGLAYRERDPRLIDAISQSLTWFKAPSSKQFFPFEGISHEQAQASAKAMYDLIIDSPSDYAFVADFHRLFNLYQSVGYNGEGVVLFTGYYSPDFKASRVKTAEFTHPLFTRPDDLVTDPVTGHPQGRRAEDGSTAPYYTRREIQEGNLFAGRELVWLADSLSAYLIHVNGSAKLRLTDGETMYIGYAGKTDRPYASLGRAMIEDGLLPKSGASIPAIRRAFNRDPARVEELMNRNESYVFFTEYEGDRWPSGSLGVRVTAESSLATDKKIYPRGGVVLVDTEAITFTGGREPFRRFMLDQDTGGAIQAPGRADLFLGIGESAGILAGSQYAEGTLYYFFLKPEYVEQFQ